MTLIILIPVLTLSCTAYVFSDYEVSDFGENVHIDESELLHSSSVYNILLMGIDTLNTESSSRSDAMILLSLDTKNREIKLSSFLRDSYVNIPGYGYMKLNAACVYGGPQLVCDTIEANFGIRIDDYAKVGYDMFIKIIDAVAGSTIPEIDETEAKALRLDGFETAPGTDIHVDGKNALHYCRIRKGQDDFSRTGRQGEVISLVLKKLPFSNPVRLLKTAKDIAGTIECSVESSELSGLLLKAVLCITGDIGQMTVPADGTWYNDTKNYQAVLVVDFQANNEKLNEFLYK
jgi:LCP family protein required for cell wall assembly